jgi:glycosyltransferase involved in cell wall biosynthesis
MAKFSIIIPVYSELEAIQGGASSQRHFRGKTVQRAIKSVMAQQFKDWELILVDDGCCDDITPRILDAFADMEPEKIKVLHTDNGNRAIARNRGMDAATGEWICWLDSDDEYCTHYLRELNQATIDFPEYSIFNFGSLLYWPDHHTTIRPTFEPKIEGKGHEWFRSGHIGCGSFIFKRELWSSKKKYRIPDEANPFQFAADTKFDWKLTREEDEWKYDNTENPEGLFSDGVKRQGSSLGNPWGDDFIQFYFLTRDNHSKPLDVLLYIQYPRAHEEVYTDFGEVFDTGVED